MLNRWRSMLIAMTAFVLLSSAGLAAPGCPFCPPTQPTFSEQLADCDIACLAKWVSKTETESEDEVGSATTTFAVVEMVRTGQTKLAKDARITVDFLCSGKPGDLFFLIGKRGDDKTAWSLPVEVTEISYGYIRQAPSLESPPEQRLKYFFKFLEFSDPTVGNDAFAEFSRARYSDVAALADWLPREKIRGWLASDQTTKMRLGFYGLLLGLCGHDEDAAFLEDRIFAPVDENDVRLGIDGMMGGYLLLRGKAGLARLMDGKLKSPDTQRTDLFAVLNALRFAGEYNRDRIPLANLQEALRLYLDREEFVEVVLPDLARWCDWSVLNRLIDGYGKPPLETVSAKIKVVQFAQASLKDQPANGVFEERITRAEEFLKRVEAESPELMKQTRRPLPLKK